MQNTGRRIEWKQVCISSALTAVLLIAVGLVLRPKWLMKCLPVILQGIAATGTFLAVAVALFPGFFSPAYRARVRAD